MPSYGSVIALDLEPVSYDVGPIPLDDVLQFRADHMDTHRRYMRNLRRFIAELATVDVVEEREALLFERRQEIADAAYDIRRSTRQALPEESVFVVAWACWRYLGTQHR